METRDLECIVNSKVNSVCCSVEDAGFTAGLELRQCWRWRDVQWLRECWGKQRVSIHGLPHSQSRWTHISSYYPFHNMGHMKYFILNISQVHLKMASYICSFSV